MVSAQTAIDTHQDTKWLNRNPVFWCQLGLEETKEYCVFSDVTLTKSNHRFQPIANITKDITDIKKIRFNTSKPHRSVIPILTDDLCKTFSALEWFHIEESSIEEVEKDALKLCVNLTIFDLRHNKVSYLHKDTFKYQTILKTLFLDWNELTKLEVTLFSNLISLDFLQVSDNELTEFPPDLIRQNKNLTHIYCYSNHISEIDYVRILKYLPHLKEIGYNSNELSCIVVDKMKTAFKDRGVSVYKKSHRYERFYEKEEIDSVECLPDLSWMASSYRKSKDNNDDELCGSIVADDKDLQVLRGQLEQTIEEKLTSLEKTVDWNLKSVHEKLDKFEKLMDAMVASLNITLD